MATAQTAHVSTMSASEAARIGAEAAGRAALAAALAVENAAKPGGATSEFKLTLGSMLAAAGIGALKAFSIIPGPWQIPALVGLGSIAAAGAYSASRGAVKKAVLGAAVAAIAAAPAREPT